MTLRTPGARHAARRAAFRSLGESSCPQSVTVPPFTTTEMVLARRKDRLRKAASIWRATSRGSILGLISIRLTRPLMPTRLRIADSAARLWYSHSTLPDNTNQPCLTATFTLRGGIDVFHANTLWAALAMSLSDRQSLLGSSTSRSAITPSTPLTRHAAVCALHFCA